VAIGTDTAQASSAAPSRPASSPGLVWLALSIVCVVWGSTYLAIRVVVRTAPPLLSAGLRFLVAAAVLAAVLALWHRTGRVLRVGWRGFAASAVAGGLLLLGGNGLVVIAEQWVPSGLTALVLAAVPLWVVVLRALTHDRPRTATVAGVLLGFAGIALLLLPGERPDGAPLGGLLIVVAASLAWAVGSFVSPRLPLPRDPFVATAYEMLAGGLLMVVAGGLRGERLAPGSVSTASWVALGYLVLFGSLVAFTAYVWLLSHAPISLAATNTYVNPVVAVALGAALLGESVTAAMLAGGAIVVTSVAIVVRTETRGAACPATGTAAGPPPSRPRTAGTR
jgi:drug/metabolite transporter (DMT)-like permease